MTNKPLVVQSEHLAAEAAGWLAQHCRVERVSPVDADRLIDLLGEASGLVVRTYTKVDESLLAHGPALRVVGRAGGGLDHIDVGACRARGIEVVYTPDANTQAVVEYVLTILCDAMRPRTTLTAAVDLQTWTTLRAEQVCSRELHELSLGLLGFGRIGRRLARAAGALGLTVRYHDLCDIPETDRGGATPVDAETLFATSDVVSIHVDGRPGNRGFVGSNLLDRMRQDVLLINTSRGFVVDNIALATFLRGHPEARAYLDVHDPEPIDADYPLLGLVNATLSPHLASRTRTAMESMSWVVRDVVRVLAGETPEFPAPVE